ncbi:unnamed protein product [Clavelina lepadiformis]|uniref:RING-type domain-containing protein n=1 Tax=Clavelina lepadiformis TaxID=159417 RepID=A0ABP0FWP6_CLALP
MAGTTYSLFCLLFAFKLCWAMTTDGPSSSYYGAIVFFNYTGSRGDGMLGSQSTTDEIGIYGSHSPKTSASGMIVHSLDKVTGIRDGCSSFMYPGINSSTPWIALISRGNCTFSEKINNAYNRNATGVIVYSEENDKAPPVMSHTDAPKIVAISIHYDLGSEVAALVNDGNVVSASILPGEEHINSSGSFQLEKTSIIFVSVSFMILMLVSLAWLVFYYIQRFRMIQTHNRSQRLRASLAQKALAKIPVLTVKRGDSVISSETICAVCLESYKIGDTIRELPCKHIFHKKCIDPWLQSKRTCPMCKVNVLKALGLEEHDNPALDVERHSETEETSDAPVDQQEQDVAESSLNIIANSNESPPESDDHPHFSGSGDALNGSSKVDLSV